MVVGGQAVDLLVVRIGGDIRKSDLWLGFAYRWLSSLPVIIYARNTEYEADTLIERVYVIEAPGKEKLVLYGVVYTIRL